VRVTSLSGFPGYGASDIITATITIYPIAIGKATLTHGVTTTVAKPVVLTGFLDQQVIRFKQRQELCD